MSIVSDKIDDNANEAKKKILALMKIGQIINGTLEFTLVEKQREDIKKLLTDASDLLPSHYQNSKNLKDIKESKVLSFVDSQNLIYMVSEMEYFIFDSLKIILEEYDDKLKNKITLDINTFNQFQNINQIKSYFIDSYLNEITYKKPQDYKNTIIEILSMNKNDLNNIWDNFVEIKARRDLGVHNRWIVNDTYLRKINHSEFNLGDEVSINYTYFKYATDTIIEFIETISNHCKNKFI